MKDPKIFIVIENWLMQITLSIGGKIDYLHIWQADKLPDNKSGIDFPNKYLRFFKSFIEQF